MFVSLSFILTVAYATLLGIHTFASAAPVAVFFGQITASQLIQISPASESCNPSSQFPDECRTAAQAAPFINQAFSDYNITSLGEKVALLSLMLFETSGFEFDTNHFPGTPGQGTRNMMSFTFVLEYALDTPAVASQASALVGGGPSNPAITADTQNAVRSLVLSDELSFASAMWFYTQSGPDKAGCTGNQTIVDGLQAATQEGWENYIEQCVFTTVTPDRQAIWQSTLAVLG